MGGVMWVSDMYGEADMVKASKKDDIAEITPDPGAKDKEKEDDSQSG